MFDYKAFSQDLINQAKSLVPEDINLEEREYLFETMEKFSIMTGEALMQIEKITEEQVAMGCQIIAEWVFHKSIDLFRSGIPKEYWDAILQKIAFTMFEHIGHGFREDTPYETMLQIIEKNVLKDYRKCIEKIYEENLISKETKDSALKQNNIDEMNKLDIIQETETDESQLPKTKKNKFLQKINYYFKNLFTIIVVGIAISIIAEIVHRQLYILPDKILLISLLLTTGAIITVIFATIGFNRLKNADILYELAQTNNTKIENSCCKNPNHLYERLGVDLLSIHLSHALVDIATPEKGGLLLSKINILREYLTDNYGYIIPKVRIMDTSELSHNEYSIYVRSNIVSSGFVYPDKYMINIEDVEDIELPENDTIIAVSPISSKTVAWISENFVKKYPAICAKTAYEVIIEHLNSIAIKYSDEIFTVTNAQNLIELVKSAELKPFVDKLIPELISYSDFRQILVNLIKEKVSIRDVNFICEKLLDYARETKDPDTLSERLRTALGRRICMAYTDENVLYAITLTQELENHIANKFKELINIVQLDKKILLEENFKQLENTTRLIELITRLLAEQEEHKKVVILCSPTIRLYLYRLLEKYIPDITVISITELTADIKVENIETIGNTNF